MANKKSLGKLAAVSLLSAAVGAVAGILYAPQSGDKTRKELAKQAKGLADEGKKLTSQVVKQAKKRAKKIRR